MVIIGIDPGTTQIGFGVIKNESNRFKALDYGIIKNSGKDQSNDGGVEYGFGYPAFFFFRSFYRQAKLVKRKKIQQKPLC